MSFRILVADDSQGIRDLLQMSLETLGYSVVLAEDGERALTRIDAERPDLLIMDVMMPKVNGFQVCRRIKSDPATRDTPVILLTARTREEDVFWGRDCGADEYITKPFRTKELQTCIERLLRRQVQVNSDRVAANRGPRREEALDESQIVMMRWDPRAMDVFRKKYGEIRFSEALRALRAAAEKFLDENRQNGPVGVHVPFGLSIVMEGSGPKALSSAQDLVGTLNALAVTFYDVADQARGHIPCRNPRSNRMEHLPLLSFAARIDPDNVI